MMNYIIEKLNTKQAILAKDCSDALQEFFSDTDDRTLCELQTSLSKYLLFVKDMETLAG